ncbi:hypothetical protein B0H65DRAFT_579458 [Neurospora tetraspora]|uniref:Uncharacterized protein n=1 Tax=Neurospora tetraspora TaxID=94610 RepID=A0AAE0J849_9PEZI|nr:hypothetical protein B0H65DRAFT_579458 [Neurospora tetraspora]
MSPVTMATTALTVVSTMATIVQQMPTPRPTTTVPLPEPSETASQSSGPGLFVPEPYYSGTSFFASIANILYMFVYTIPRGVCGILELFLMFRRQREALAKEAEERSHRIQMTEGINRMVVLMESQTERMNKMAELMGTMVEDNKALKEDNKGLSQRLERVETDNTVLRRTVERLETGMKEMKEENKAMQEGITEAVEKGTKEGIKGSLTEASQAMTEAVKEGVKEGFKDVMKEANPSRMQDSEKLINGMERMVTVVQGLEGVFRVALEGVETRIGAIEHMVDWMLDYHLDENKRFHALKDGSTSTASSSTTPTSWGGDLVENRIIVDEGDWEDHKKPWEK